MLIIKGFHLRQSGNKHGWSFALSEYEALVSLVSLFSVVKKTELSYFYWLTDHFVLSHFNYLSIQFILGPLYLSSLKPAVCFSSRKTFGQSRNLTSVISTWDLLPTVTMFCLLLVEYCLKEIKPGLSRVAKGRSCTAWVMLNSHVTSIFGFGLSLFQVVVLFVFIFFFFSPCNSS